MQLENPEIDERAYVDFVSFEEEEEYTSVKLSYIFPRAYALMIGGDWDAIDVGKGDVLEIYNGGMCVGIRDWWARGIGGGDSVEDVNVGCGEAAAVCNNTFAFTRCRASMTMKAISDGSVRHECLGILVLAITGSMSSASPSVSILQKDDYILQHIPAIPVTQSLVFFPFNIDIYRS